MLMTRYFVSHRLNDETSVLLNTLSGAIDLIQNRYLPLLSEPERLSDHPDIYQALSERGYFFPSKEAEEDALRGLFEKFQPERRPTMFVICPTYACNLRCVYCFEGDLTKEEPRLINTDEVDAIFDAISKLSPEGAAIQLFGGEPFLPGNQAIVGYILSKAAARDCQISAVTNGVNLSFYMPLLLKHKDRLIDFQVTVDGPPQIHDARRPRAGGQGTFHEIVDNIDEALSHGVRIRLRVNVDRVNISSLSDLADIIRSKGWDKLSNFGALLSPVDDHKGADLPDKMGEDETARYWFAQIKKDPQLSIFRPDLWRNLDFLITTLSSTMLSFPRFNYCESNNLGCYTFGTDGKIYLCAEAIGDPRTVVGDYYPRLSMDDDAIAKWNGRSVLTLEKCRTCSIATLCGGGCAYAALSINGSIDEPYCNGAIDTVHAYLDSMKEKLLTL